MTWWTVSARRRVDRRGTFNWDSTAGAAQSAKTVDIVGKDSFVPNNYLLNTYRFQPGIISVHQGQQVVFNNKTTDAHTMTLVDPKDLPRKISQVFNCALCNAVNGLYFPDPNAQKPAGFQIDNGELRDDDPADADTPDPVAPGGLIEDFALPATAMPLVRPKSGTRRSSARSGRLRQPAGPSWSPPSREPRCTTTAPSTPGCKPPFWSQRRRPEPTRHDRFAVTTCRRTCWSGQWS